jgi:hypothetical protein
MVKHAMSRRRPILARGAMIVLLSFMVAGCGALGGDDENSTPTSEPQPTATLPPLPGSPAASPAAQQPTPPANIGLSSPTGVEATPAVAAGTPAASPVVVTGPGPATPAATPGEAPASDGPTGAPSAMGTPAAPATPAAGTPAAPVVVTSCQPDNVPAISGDDPAYVVLEDLNFRAGPGSDCDTLSEPLGAGVAVTVTSDPVVREGEEGLEWVRIEVDGVTGWVAAEFIVPAG